MIIKYNDSLIMSLKITKIMESNIFAATESSYQYGNTSIGHQGVFVVTVILILSFYFLFYESKHWQINQEIKNLHGDTQTCLLLLCVFIVFIRDFLHQYCLSTSLITVITCFDCYFSYSLMKILS